MMMSPKELETELIIELIAINQRTFRLFPLSIMNAQKNAYKLGSLLVERDEL